MDDTLKTIRFNEVSAKMREYCGALETHYRKEIDCEDLELRKNAYDMLKKVITLAIQLFEQEKTVLRRPNSISEQRSAQSHTKFKIEQMMLDTGLLNKIKQKTGRKKRADGTDEVDDSEDVG